KENGYSVDIFTGKKSRFLPKNADNVHFLGYPYLPDKIRALILANEILLRREISMNDLSTYDLIFNNQPNTFLYNASLNYLHGPSFFESFMNQDGKISNSFLYNTIRALGIYNRYKNGFFLTHGNYTRDYAIKGFSLLKINPRKIVVVNTPVQYPVLDKVPEKELSTVLTFGRISPDKNLELISRVSRRVPAKFIIAGYTAMEHINYVRNLRDIMPDNVIFIENPSDSDKINLYRKANIYLHTKPREHFGVTVAEGLWFGCIPVVPKSGGAWKDIVSEGKFGYGYDNEDDLISTLNYLRLNQIDNNAFESRLRFSVKNFDMKMTDIISNITP
ncbi:MAG: glycosyltransferase family 4 protein, partial [Thermoplasmatales archaeon]